MDLAIEVGLPPPTGPSGRVGDRGSHRNGPKPEVVQHYKMKMCPDRIRATQQQPPARPDAYEVRDLRCWVNRGANTGWRQAAVGCDVCSARARWHRL